MKTDEIGIVKRPRFLDEMRVMFSFTPEEEQKFLEMLTWRTYKKRHVLDGQNEILQYMFYINRGAARTFYVEKGTEYNYAFSFEGQFLVRPQSMMRKNKQTMFVQFLEDTEICYVPISTLGAFQSHSTDKFRQFLNIALIKYTEYLEEHLFMLRMDARDRYNWAIERFPHILEVISVSQLASYLNLTKETLYRIRSGKY